MPMKPWIKELADKYGISTNNAEAPTPIAKPQAAVIKPGTTVVDQKMAATADPVKRLNLVAAHQIIELMAAKGITRKVLAAGINKNPAYVAGVLSGRYNTSISTLVDIARVLDTEVKVEFVKL